MARLGGFAGFLLLISFELSLPLWARPVDLLKTGVSCVRCHDLSQGQPVLTKLGKLYLASGKLPASVKPNIPSADLYELNQALKNLPHAGDFAWEAMAPRDAAESVFRIREWSLLAWMAALAAALVAFLMIARNRIVLFPAADPMWRYWRKLYWAGISLGLVILIWLCLKHLVPDLVPWLP
jgi:hypothetical protein